MSKTMRLVLGVLAPLWLASVARAQVHEDTKLGYKIRPPKEFSAIPLQPDEEWIVARWLSDKPYYQNDPTTGYQHDLKPELHVVCFQDAVVKADKIEVEKKTDAEKSIIKIAIKNPFKDYRDYLKRTYNEGGYFIEKEEKAEVEGVKVECLEIKVERGTWGGPRRIVTWIFDGPIADFAVQFEMFESTFAKLKKDVLSTMRSFRLIAGAGGGAGAGVSTGGSDVIVADLDAELGDWNKLTPSQRALKKLEQQTKEQEKAVAGLIEGWKAKKIGRCFVLFDIEEKYAREYAVDATAVLDYLDDAFPWLGEGEYVREPTIRVCKDSDEENMYRKGSSWSWGKEIVTHKDFDRGLSGWSESGYVTSSVCQHWFRERSGELWSVMPAWLHTGLDASFEKCHAKGKGVEFFTDSWERVDISQQRALGKLTPLRQIMQFERNALWSGNGNQGSECAAAVRFFLTGPRKAKETLKTYLQALLPLAQQRDEERKKAMEANSKSAKPKTEEEEDAAFKAAHEKQDDSEKKFLEEAFAKSFGAWTDADWKSLDAAYQKSLK